MELEVRISDLDVKTGSISSAKIRWHIEHSLLVMNGIILTMQASDPGQFKRAINFPKLYDFATGDFREGGKITKIWGFDWSNRRE